MRLDFDEDEEDDDDDEEEEEAAVDDDDDEDDEDDESVTAPDEARYLFIAVLVSSTQKRSCETNRKPVGKKRWS